MASAQDPWSNIPLDLAGLVLQRLCAHVDRVRFAAVCPQWRSAAREVKLPPPLPLLALKVGDIFYSMPRGEPLHFAGRNRFDTACANWLMYRRSCDLLLVDPFSGATMTLPAQSSVQLGDEDDGEDSRYSHDSTDDGEDSRDSHDSADDDEDSEGGHDSTDDGDDSEDSSVYSISAKLLEDVKDSDVIKLMVCSPNLIAALFQGRECNRIAVCRPGGSMWSVAGDLSLWIADMAFYQGKLYVVDFDEHLLAMDISVDDNTGDPRIAQIERVINASHFDDPHTFLRMLYLVESCGSLLLVRRRTFHMHVHGEEQIHTFAGQCEPDLSIFEADFAWSQWAKVTTLADNHALFLGPCSRDVCMPQGDSPGNRVWFLDDYKDFHCWKEWPSSLSDNISVAKPKPFSPLPMISWKDYYENAGAAWLFPAN